MKKKLKFLSKSLGIILVASIILTGCKQEPSPVPNEHKGMSYFSYFDTVSYIFDYRGDSDEEFGRLTDGASALLEKYHQLFDIYHEYSGINNLATINKMAGQGPVEVDKELVDFLLYTKQIYSLTKGETNVMLGAVLSIWHNYREEVIDNNGKPAIPEMADLEEAYKHCDIDLLVIDEQNNTIEITDPLAAVDVGALGKGYATEKVGQYLENEKAFGYVLNIGGNIRTIGSKTDGSGWVTGIRNPRAAGEYSTKIILKDTACVTSGDYERYYMYEGERYHHIIDKDTLKPAKYFASITIITKDSGLADGLSTALFCMSYEDGLEIVENIGNVDVLWIYENGEMKYTNNMANMLAE